MMKMLTGCVHLARQKEVSLFNFFIFYCCRRCCCCICLIPTSLTHPFVEIYFSFFVLTIQWRVNPMSLHSMKLTHLESLFQLAHLQDWRGEPHRCRTQTKPFNPCCEADGPRTNNMIAINLRDFNWGPSLMTLRARALAYVCGVCVISIRDADFAIAQSNREEARNTHIKYPK